VTSFLSILSGVALVLSVSLAGCEPGKASGHAATEAARAASDEGPTDLAPYRIELIELALRAATAIPRDPHLKDRSRAQQLVATTCLKLGRPDLAVTAADGIENWRRGAVHADLACYYALRNQPEPARRHASVAADMCNITDDWRRDRLRTMVAQALVLLGDDAEAERFESAVTEEAERGKVIGARAARAAEGSFDEQLAAMDGLLALGGFDVTVNTLTACTELFKRFYATPERRDLIERRIRTSSESLPLLVRLNLFLKLTDHALENQDRTTALRLLDEAEAISDGSAWPLRHGVPMVARLAAARARAGDVTRAREQADNALATYDSHRDNITNIDRAGILRPIAEAYRALGDADKARSIYRRAVDEGMENPNSRPRAEDVAATCCSMALHDVAPDAALWARLRGIVEGLGHPW
jgi:tetratricopeptide (TPR) repeat protein